MTQIKIVAITLFGTGIFAQANAAADIQTKSKASSQVEASEETSASKIPKETVPYLSPKQTIFWPVNKPVWIRLTDAPDQPTISLPLTLLGKKSDQTSDDLDRNGIKLEIPGNQFIRWINHYSKKEISYRFVADSGPPRVQISFSQAPKTESATTKDLMIYGKGLTVSLFATDDHSGVKNIGYSVNNAEFSWYEKPFQIAEEGSHSIQFYAVDNVQYASKLETARFMVDTTPPVTTLANQKSSESKVYGPRDSLILTASDERAGVKSTFYKFDSETAFHSYSGPVALNSLPEGNRRIQYYSVDKLENREPIQEKSFFLNRTPPPVRHKFLGDVYLKDSIAYIASNTKVDLVTEPGRSKPKEVTYQVDDGLPQIFSSPFRISVPSTVRTLNYRVTDEFGNVSPFTKALLYLDNQAPKTSYAHSGPFYAQASDVYFINESTRIILSATDEESGVQGIFYQWDETPPKEYLAPITVKDAGRRLFRYWAVDHVNNQEKSHAVMVVMDNIPPEIHVAFSNNALGNKASPDSKDDSKQIRESYPVGSTLLANAVDGLSGIQDITIAVDQEAPKKYVAPIQFDVPRTYQVTLSARDRVGNEAKKVVRFKIGR